MRVPQRVQGILKRVLLGKVMKNYRCRLHRDDTV